MNTETKTTAPALPEIDLTWTPFRILLKREIERFYKVSVQTLLTPIVSASLYLLIFGVSLGVHIQMSHGLSYLEFIIPGLVMMGLLNNAFQNSSSSIVSSKFSGDLEDLKVSPLSSTQIIWAMSVGGLFRGFLVGLVTWLVGQVFFWLQEGEWLGVAHPWAVLYFFIVGGLSFAQLGMSVAFWAKTFDQLSAVGAFVILPLTYLGGVFFSLEGLHPFWQNVAKFNPLLYFINGVRYGFLGESDVSVGVAAIVSAVALLFFYVLAYRTLSQSSFLRW